MAIECSFSPHTLIQQPASIRKPVPGMAILRKSQLPVKKKVKLQINSSLRNQVFEDHSKGIVCYKDDNGEIICEGFDEGPRHHPQCPSTPYPLSDASILEHLQQRWLQILDGRTANDSAALEEHSCNGSNTLH